jgi:hypothetical protein
MQHLRLGLLSSMTVLGAVLGAAGCGNISFDVSQSIPDTTITGDPTAPALVGTSNSDLMLNIQAEVQQQHSGPASAAYLKDLSFTISVPTNGTFYFASAVTILLVPKNPASNLPTVTIATLSPIPHDQNTIHVIPVPGVNMLPYSNEGATIQATAVGSWPREDTTYSGYVVVQVKI